jgi:small subunit ribosomal protein S16
MSTKIRLARAGRRNLPSYQLVVADDRSPRDGRFIENIGHYSPTLANDNRGRFIVNRERVEYWLGVGARPTDRVIVLLRAAGVGGTEKFRARIRSNSTSKEKKKKK